jgi:lipoyl(octanoyl) transferase
MGKHSTFNIQHSTPKFSEGAQPLDVGRSRLNLDRSPNSQVWLVLNSGRCGAAFNMALDEALLEAAARLGNPVLRFYGWTEPAATFGYFQKYAEVERVTPLRPLIRRPTGGGIVPHDADWTYSFVVPPGHEWHLLKAEESYRRVHDWLRLAFAELNVETELAPGRKVSTPGQCFAGHEKFDLLWRGKKIAGAAQRRNKLGLLIQGSVQPPSNRIARTDWENAMRAAAARGLSRHWRDLSPDAKLLEHSAKLEQEKYTRTDYNQKR